MLASDDGILQVVVPPGTIPKQVDFSIQPITNTLEGSPGIAYRILPEGLIFLKPVSITFDLQEAGIETEVSDLLFLAYQDKKGHHYLASDTELDKAGKKLTVKPLTLVTGCWHSSSNLKSVKNRSQSEIQQACA